MRRETMTLNLSAVEMQVLDRLSAEHDMSKTAVIRQALRFYQLVHERAKAGETVHFSGDIARAVEFVGPGFGQDLKGGA